LGVKESGGKAALPIWIDFMRVALADKPIQALEPPIGINKAFIDPKTGLLAQEEIHDGIWEFFLEENTPTKYAPIEEVEFEEQGLEGEVIEEESLF
jgi:penicillin-binding protein 1A